MKLNLILNNEMENYLHSIRGDRSCAAYIAHLLKSLHDEVTKKENITINDANNGNGSNHNVRRKNN